MKYLKGEFITIPNKSTLRGLDPVLQVVFLWLCDHSDDNMQSFPSRQVLADECGVSVRTLDRAMQELVSKGFIAKSARYSQNVRSSNLYEVVIFAGGDKSAPRGDKNDTRGVQNLRGGGDKNSTQNSTQLTQPIELNSKSNDLLVNSGKPSVTKPKLELFFYMLVRALGFSETTKFTAGREAKLRKRGQTYTGSEILKAATNLGSDAYMQGENDAGKRYGTIDYLLRNDESVDKYLQMSEMMQTSKSINGAVKLTPEEIARYA